MKIARLGLEVVGSAQRPTTTSQLVLTTELPSVVGAQKTETALSALKEETHRTIFLLSTYP